MFGIWFILAITVVIAISFVLRSRFNEDIAYMAVSVVLLASLLLAVAFGTFFNRALGDWGTMEFLFGLLAMSPVLGLIGVVLVVNAFRQVSDRVTCGDRAGLRASDHFGVSGGEMIGGSRRA